ncbi:extracellular solute-binding protein [Paenibacillus sp. J5C_2022]|nr:extracellular solute-binding protein [Paenibacillus sp. J5C2022]
MKKMWTLVLAAMLTLSACTGTNNGNGQGSEEDGNAKDGVTTVEIAVMHTSRFLEMAVKQFEQANPNIDIVLKEHMALPEVGSGAMMKAISQADVEKYVQSVTTSLLSGKGSDLILMNNLPEDKFIEKGLLIDLNKLMASDASFQKSSYYENIIGASEHNGGVYAMPFSYTIGVVYGNADLMSQFHIEVDDGAWTWEQMREISDQLKEQAGTEYQLFINLFSSSLLYEYIASNYSWLVQDGQANFDSERFRAIMKDIKSLYDEGVLKEDFTYDYDKALFRMGSLSGIGADSFNQTILQVPALEDEGRGSRFQPSLELGLNSQSTVQDEAWAFMKYLLSEEMQSSPELIGIPMHKGVVAEWLQQASESGDAHQKEQVDAVKMLLEEMGGRKSSDDKVASIAIEEFAAYMSGQKSAEAVSEIIQNRVMTYLNE